MGLSYQVEQKVHTMLHHGVGIEEICKRLGVSDHFVRKELDKIKVEELSKAKTRVGDLKLCSVNKI